MNKILTLKDTINIGKGKRKVPVAELVESKGEIMNYIKNGYIFDDEVLKLAHITKRVGKPTVTIEVVDRKVAKEKKYAKDTESLKNILKSLNTIDNQSTDDDFFTKNNEESDVFDITTED